MNEPVKVEPSELVDMMRDRLIDYDRADLVRFWNQNFGDEELAKVDEDGDGILLTYLPVGG